MPRRFRILEPEGGFTWRVLLMLIFVGLVFLPVHIFLCWSAPVDIVGVISYVIIILFAELTTRYGSRPTRQEVFLLWALSGLASGEALFTTLVYNVYLVSNDILPQFPEVAEALSKLWWVAPPPTSPGVLERNLLRPEWAGPLAITILFALLCGKVVDVALGSLMYQIFVIHENLPFPYQHPPASLVITLAERDPDRVKWFVYAAVFGLGYGFFLWTLPLATGCRPIPLFVDASHLLERVLPGATLAFITSPTSYVMGTLLPTNIALSLFLGSVSIYVIGNHLLVRLFPEERGLWLWSPGIGHFDAYKQSMIRVWALPLVGLAFAIAIGVVLQRPGAIIYPFRSLRRVRFRAEEEPPLPPWLAIAMWIGGTAASAILSYLLCSGIAPLPFWALLLFLLLSTVMSFLNSLVSTASVGLSGFAVDLRDPITGYDFLQEISYSVLLRGRVDVWFAPLVVTWGGQWWCTMFKVAQLTGTRPRTFVKALYTLFPIIWLLGFLYTQLLWKLAPVPSSLYWWPSVIWPVGVRFRYMWASGRMLEQIAGSPRLFLVPFSLGLGVMILSKYVALPISLPVFLAGAIAPTPGPIAAFVGSILGRLLERRYGDAWRSRRDIIAAGVAAGEGIAIIAGVGLLLLRKAIFYLPY